MKILLGIAIIIGLLSYACCVVAGKADDAAEKYYDSQMKGQ